MCVSSPNFSMGLTNPPLRNILNGKSTRMSPSLRKTSSSCFRTRCSSTKIIPLSGKQPANSRCQPCSPCCRRLIKVSGAFCEIDVRPPSPVRGTTIRTQRAATLYKREDKAENASSAPLLASNLVFNRWRGLPTTSTDVARTQSPRKRPVRASVDDRQFTFSHRRTLLRNHNSA